MKVVISSGHGKKIRGARGSPVPPQCDEVDEARKVVEATATALQKRGVEVTTFHDDTSTSQSQNLNTIVAFHNKQPPHDLDVSVHFNAYDGTAHGAEVLYVSSAGAEVADDVVDAICKVSGLTNRGPKKRTDLAFLNGTNETAVLIETAFCDNTSDCNTYHQNFDVICNAIADAIAGEEVQPGPTPTPEPEPTPPVPVGRPQLSEGSEGPAVEHLQMVLGIPVDGDFGAITANQTEGLQRATGCTPYDAIVGEKTWAEVDSLEKKMREEEKRLSEKLTEDISKIASESAIAEYQWPDRGMSPPGYVPGMALCYAVAVQDLSKGRDYAQSMAQSLGMSSVDALAAYASEFNHLNISRVTPNDRLRALFVLMIGLGMRESSGRYCEGRDLSASNVESDTCEAGLFQTSWNIRSTDSTLPGLLTDYWGNPHGFLNVFQENVDPTSENLDTYGSGDGAKYQWLAKYSPCFAAMVAGVGLRTRKDHWGPVKRKEVTIKKEAETMLRQVDEELVP